MLSSNPETRKNLQTSYFSLGNSFSEISTQKSTPLKNNALMSKDRKLKINFNKVESKAHHTKASKHQLETSSKSSSKGPLKSLKQISSSKKMKVNRKLPVKKSVDPSENPSLTEKMAQSPEAHQNFDYLLGLNSVANSQANKEIIKTDLIFAELFNKLHEISDQESQEEASLKKSDIKNLLQLEPKFNFVDLNFQNFNTDLKATSTHTRLVKQVGDSCSDQIKPNIELENKNIVEDSSQNSSTSGEFQNLRKRIKKTKILRKNAPKSICMARKSTFDTDEQNVSEGLIVNNGSHIFSDVDTDPQEKENKDFNKKDVPVIFPIVYHEDLHNQIIRKELLEHNKLIEKNIRDIKNTTNSMFGFSEAENINIEIDEKIQKNNKSQNKFNFLFCQSSDSDKFSIENMNEEYHCDFNARPFNSNTDHISDYNYMYATNSLGRVEADWLDRPKSYGPMSFSFGEDGISSNLEIGCFDEQEQFRQNGISSNFEIGCFDAQEQFRQNTQYFI